MAPNRPIIHWRIGCVLLFVLFDIALQAQSLELRRRKIMHGMIIDGTTLRGIPSVYIKTNSFGVVSDAEGNFSMTLSYGDSLHFSHLSYLPYRTVFNVDLDHDKFVIILSPKVTFLKEVTVTSLTEDEFQRKILETTPQLSREEEIAQENAQLINHAMKFAMPLQMDSYQSYRDYMKGPQGVVLFSSNGSKGLVRAIKNVIHATPYKFPSTSKRTYNSLRNTDKAESASPNR